MKILIEVMNDNFATQSDLKELGLAIQADIKDLKTDLRELDYKLTIKLGAMVTVAAGATVTAIKLLTAFH